MWYHSLKTRQTVKRIKTRNSGGIAVALEYVDKKIEVHHLSREANPLVLDEGSGVIFVAPQDGCLMLIAVNISAKGKSTYEFRAWELTSGAAFMQREISVKDILGSFTNDGKSKALLSLPEVNQHHNPCGLRADALNDVFVIALGVSLIFVWKSSKENTWWSTLHVLSLYALWKQVNVKCSVLANEHKTENGGINCDMVAQMNSSMSALDVLLLQPSRDQFPQLLVGESGGIRIWRQETQEMKESEALSTFKDTFYSVQSFDAGTNLVTCQDFERIHKGACIFSNNIGNLYLFTQSRVVNLRLPVSHGGHGLFTVESVDEKCTKVSLAVVSKGHTINLYHLEDIHNLPDTLQDLALVPNHVLFSTQSIGAISFLNKASLVACSASSRTLSLWVGV